MQIDSIAAISPPTDAGNYNSFMGPMAEYPRLAYSMKAVRKAGGRLGGKILCGGDISGPEYEEALETFAIANSWRDSHLLPMRSVRFSVQHHMRGLRDRWKMPGDMASRPKRMASIRRKLRESTTNLDTMNDIGGCRAIMADIKGVRALLTAIRDKFPHDLHQREYNYIDEPKADGYRSHHLVFKFRPKDEGTEAFEGRRIELQVRTRLQHSWATAVEAVGLYRGQDLKHGKGEPEWLRLFELMSSEFAYAEECPVMAGVPDRSDRMREIREINKRIGATSVLEDIKNVTHYSENFVHPTERSRFYLLRYGQNHAVSVEPFWSIMSGARSLHEIEAQIELGANDAKVVLVEVDKVDKLVEAYPNYFGDVSLFIRNLRAVCDGKQVVEYSMAPQQIVAPKPEEKPDFSWLRRRYTKWTEGRR